MTPDDVIAFPMWVAVIAAIFLVLATFTAGLFTVIEAMADWSSRRT